MISFFSYYSNDSSYILNPKNSSISLSIILAQSFINIYINININIQEGIIMILLTQIIQYQLEKQNNKFLIQFIQFCEEDLT